MLNDAIDFLELLGILRVIQLAVVVTSAFAVFRAFVDRS